MTRPFGGRETDSLPREQALWCRRDQQPFELAAGVAPELPPIGGIEADDAAERDPTTSVARERHRSITQPGRLLPNTWLGGKPIPKLDQSARNRIGHLPLGVRPAREHRGAPDPRPRGINTTGL